MSGKVVVLGFSQNQMPLFPIWPSTHRAMLPVAGKPIIVHVLEQLHEAGIRHVRIAGGVEQSAVKSRLGDGTEWGMTLRYSDLKGEDLLLQTVLQFGQCAYVTGDELHLFESSIMDNAMPAFKPYRSSGFHSSGHWSTADNCLANQLWGNRGDYSCVPMSSIEQYHGANIAAASGRYPTLTLPGTRSGAQVIDWKTRIGRGVSMGTGVFLGKHCQLGSRSVLDSDCVLSNGVIVGPGCELKNMVVLPNTHIAANVKLNDAVAGPSGLFDLSGRYWPLDDVFLRASRNNHERLTGLPDQFAG